MNPKALEVWDRLKGEIALLAPAGSMATAQGDQLHGVPIRTPARGRELLPVTASVDPRQGPFGPDVRGIQNWLGKLPMIRLRNGLSQLWVDNVEPMPISAVPPMIRKSLYQPLTHRVGLWPLNSEWYPIAANANTKNDMRWAVTKPPVAIAGNSPNGTVQSARYQFRRAWRVPRYSTQPATVIPNSR